MSITSFINSIKKPVLTGLAALVFANTIPDHQPRVASAATRPTKEQTAYTLVDNSYSATLLDFLEPKTDGDTPLDDLPEIPLEVLETFDSHYESLVALMPQQPADYWGMVANIGDFFGGLEMEDVLDDNDNLLYSIITNVSIEARIGDVNYAQPSQLIMDLDGDIWYHTVVTADDPDTPRIEGGIDGDSVEIYMVHNDTAYLVDIFEWYSGSAEDNISVDADQDYLTDAEETYTHGTDPNNADSDGDGENDNIEIDQGTDPLDPESCLLVPYAPENVDASDGITGRIDVTWDPVEDANHYQHHHDVYQVLRSTTNNFESATPITGWITETSYTDDTVQWPIITPGIGCGPIMCVPETRENVMYHYWVVARNNCGDSEVSNSDSGYAAKLAVQTSDLSNVSMDLGTLLLPIVAIGPALYSRRQRRKEKD